MNRICFKTSRGLAAYVKSSVQSPEFKFKGLLDPDEIFPHKSSGYRKFSNVTCLISSFTEDMDNPGCYHVNAIVSIRTACAGAGSEYSSEYLVEAIADLFALAIGQDRSVLADLITAAGRAWAVDDSGGGDGVKAQFASRNADMALFKVDSIIPMPNGTSTTEMTAENKAQCWVDDLPFALVVRATDATEPEM